MNAARNFIITGSSGTGKSSLIKALAALHCPVYPEALRIILAEQSQQNGEALPSNNALLFLEYVLQRMVKDLQDAQTHPEQTACFYDRGLPDLLAYARRFEVSPKLVLGHSALQHYNTCVFVLEPWPEIFVQDEFRGLSYDAYARFHEQIVAAYQEMGFELISVPRATPARRADFVLDAARKLKHSRKS